jgi:hypothetical protein
MAEALEELAAQRDWNDEVWQRCFALADANCDDELVAYVYDDLIHCSGTPLFSSSRTPEHPEFDEYKQEFRDVATALRNRLSLAEAKKRFKI